MEEEGQKIKPHLGIVNFERRRYPRFSVDLPIEYQRIDSSMRYSGRTINASRGGLLVYFKERVEIGQCLKINLFFSSSSGLNSIEAVAEVVWMDIHLGEGWGDYRSGLRFLDISMEDLSRLENFLKSLTQ